MLTVSAAAQVVPAAEGRTFHLNGAGTSNWLRTHLPNGAGNIQSAFLIGSGIVYWFK
jgi:hypothetical protein